MLPGCCGSGSGAASGARSGVRRRRVLPAGVVLEREAAFDDAEDDAEQLVGAGADDLLVAQVRAACAHLLCEDADRGIVDAGGQCGHEDHQAQSRVAGFAHARAIKGGAGLAATGMNAGEGGELADVVETTEVADRADRGRW